MANVQSYFPADYRKARAAFIEACEKADLGVTSPHASVCERAGRQGL